MQDATNTHSGEVTAHLDDPSSLVTIPQDGVLSEEEIKGGLRKRVKRIVNNNVSSYSKPTKLSHSRGRPLPASRSPTADAPKQTAGNDDRSCKIRARR